MSTSTTATVQVVAKINGTAVNRADESLSEGELRQRACTELLRQAAQKAGLLSLTDLPSEDGILSEAAGDAIEAVISREINAPEPADEDCRRFFEANPARFRKDELANLRHILFAVTPGVDVAALRSRAEGVLLDVRCHDDSASEKFTESARKLSNCPSGAEGGALGWLSRRDCVEEFAREVFGSDVVGVLPRLVPTRFGLHIIEVLERDRGEIPSYEQVSGAVRATLQRQTFSTAMRQYLSLLAGEAVIEGVALEVADSPLVQ